MISNDSKRTLINIEFMRLIRAHSRSKEIPHNLDVLITNIPFNLVNRIAEAFWSWVEYLLKIICILVLRHDPQIAWHFPKLSKSKSRCQLLQKKYRLGRVLQHLLHAPSLEALLNKAQYCSRHWPCQETSKLLRNSLW